ncbi:MAG: nicotinate-nucleotide--dimethylbenzimidazole phosphoribosyltransferase [Clostridiales bacterium]|nr:nicotinate-nucleotide--dimethylbenzimidazole phosphoribosyltransferase [Clostridiales bacterium]
MEAYYGRQIECLCRSVHGTDGSIYAEALRRWDGIAKPIGGLGEFERLIAKIAAIQGQTDVSLSRRAVVIFCADNGVTAEGVTQTDSKVTAVVTENFARGIASVNRMAAVADTDVIPVDIGVAGEIREPGVRDMKIARGTANLRREPAMSMEQTLEAVHHGIALAGEMKDAGYDLLAVGEMGIGNTTTSSAVASVLLRQPPEMVTGRGAGLSSDGLQRKLAVIRDAIALHHPDPDKPFEVLATLGGFDLAGMAGLMLGGAIYRVPVILDGMISGVAALLAQAVCPHVTDYLLASHLGKEPSCALVMERLGLRPVIHGQMGLGEGTGAVMLFPLLDLAYEVYRENRTFADIHIDAYERLD